MQNTNIKKIDDNTLSVDQVMPETTITQTYSLDFLNQQLIDIQKQKDDFDAERDAELAEVQGLIDQANQLGLKTTVQIDAEKVSADNLSVNP